MVELMDEDVVQELDERWRQRFETYKRAFNRLTEATEIVRNEPDHFLLRAGLIQTFEYTFELAWNTLKDYMESEGIHTPTPKYTLRKAFQCGYLQDGKLWLKALNDRNMMSHSYYEEIANTVVTNILDKYYSLFKQLTEWLDAEKENSATPG